MIFYDQIYHDIGLSQPYPTTRLVPQLPTHGTTADRVARLRAATESDVPLRRW